MWGRACRGWDARVARRRFIIARNLAEAARDLATRTRHLERLKVELPSIEPKTGDARLAAEGALLAHPVLRRYLTRRHARLVIDTKAVTRVRQLLGIRREAQVCDLGFCLREGSDSRIRLDTRLGCVGPVGAGVRG